MKTILLVIAVIASISTYAQSWTQINDFPGSARDDGTFFKIGNKVFCGTGRNAGFNVTADFYVFDVGLETWNTVSPMPDSCRRQYATSFTSASGFGFVFGGVDANGEELNDIWRYHPGLWGVADFWTYLGTMPSYGRSGSSSFVIGNKAYIIGGNNQSSITETEVWEFDMSNHTWTQKNSLPNLGMWRGVSFVDDTTGYIGLGINSVDEMNGEFYRYLPTIDQWELVPELTMAPRAYVACDQIGDSVYLYGGVDTLGNYSNSFERINLPSLTIDVLTIFPTNARKGTMAFASHDDFYLTTGITTTQRLNETWKAGHVIGLEEMNQLEFHVYQSGQEILIPNYVNRGNFQLLSMDGRIIKNHDLQLGKSINITGIDEGVYLYHFEGDGNQMSGRIFLTN